jgi:hypothetical protein
MTYFQLATGKTILINDILSLINLSDEDYFLTMEEYIADDRGFDINDPFFLGNTEETGFIIVEEIDN